MAVRSGDVPGGLVWKRSCGKPSVQVIVEYSMANLYKRVTDARTGDVVYYRLLSADAPMTPAEQLDAEPQRELQIRFYVGSKCWFVDTDGRWYLCVVVARTPKPGARITIRPVLGYDDTREKPWPYGGDLEFPGMRSNPLFQRLRPLRARKA